MANSTPPTTRSERKRQAILDAAQAAFLADGYDRTTMDDVAAHAAVSKQTVYKHFSDKQTLFAAIITGEIEATEALTADMVAELGASDDLEGDLRRFARRHAEEVLQPHLVQLRRIVIAESQRFPGLARTWYAQGPERGHEALAEQIVELARRGLLAVPDPLAAAETLNWLILAGPLTRATFHLPPPDLAAHTTEAVRIFLAAHGP